jgi:uncharacterized membrane protein
VTDDRRASERRPVLFAAGAGGMLALLLCAVVFWDVRWLLASAVAFVGTAVVAAVLDGVREQQRKDSDA